jgi:hypothetical protein
MSIYIMTMTTHQEPKYILNQVDDGSGEERYVVLPFDKPHQLANPHWYSGATFIDSPEDVKHIRHLIIN